MNILTIPCKQRGDEHSNSRNDHHISPSRHLNMHAQKIIKKKQMTERLTRQYGNIRHTGGKKEGKTNQSFMFSVCVYPTKPQVSISVANQ